MEIASLRETVNFDNKVNAVSPYNLGQVLASFATQTYVTNAIAHAVIDPSQIDLHEYAKKTDLPTKLSQMINDDNYVQTVSGLIPAALLPAYVDDVLEYPTFSSFPNIGEAGKIYVTLDTNLTYRWGGSEYVEISKSLALGETSSTAYRGDRGKAAYDHSQSTGNPHGLSLSDLGILVSASEINYLSGIDSNIASALDDKLDLTGGTMTGALILARTPVNTMEAANKDYVDTAINGISVTVTQNVTKINELNEDVDGLTQTVGTQASTLTQVQNDITGLNQTTSNLTSDVTAINTWAGGVNTTISHQSESITTLEQTVNLLDLGLQKDNVVIVVDEDNKPLDSSTESVPFAVKFTGNVVTGATVTVSGTVSGTTAAISNSNVNVTYSTANAITDGIYTITASYTSGGVTYTDSKTLSIITVPKGSDGTPGTPGISVTSITEWYYSSTSRTTTTGGTWITTAPTAQDGKYIWTKTVIAFSNSTTTETTPICVTGDKGEDGVIGEDGTSITNVDVLYYQSNSATTLIGGSWSTTAPTWANNKYIWTKNRVYYLDGDGTTWSEDSEPISISGQKGSTGDSGTIISDTAPSDTTKAWLNSTDGFIYYYDDNSQSSTYQTWVKANDYDDNLFDMNAKINQTASDAATYADSSINTALQTVYTKEEVDTKIQESAGQISETFTRTITESTASGNSAYTKVVDLEANITRGIDSQGKPYILLNTGETEGFGLKIANDRIVIMQGSNEVSEWASDKFNVATVITNSLGLGDFEFVIKGSTPGSRGLSFRHKE